MGNCQCAGSGSEEVLKTSPRDADHAETEKAVKVPVPVEFQKIQGLWRTEGDYQMMGRHSSCTAFDNLIHGISNSIY